MGHSRIDRTRPDQIVAMRLNKADVEGLKRLAQRKGVTRAESPMPRAEADRARPTAFASLNSLSSEGADSVP